jgi:pilus assembly protein CpaB
VTARRRALLLLTLALLLASLAAAGVQRREAAVERALGPGALVLVTRAPVAAGRPPAAARPLLRSMPRRFAPPDAVVSAAVLAGARTAVALPAGTVLTRAVLHAPGGGGAVATLAPGERAAEVLARADPAAVVAGARVDVLVTREASAGGAGSTLLALANVEVLAARPVPAAAAGAGWTGDADPAAGGPLVAASLRVRVRDAVYLAAAQSFARELRLLVRAPGDRARGTAGLAVGERLR